MEREDNIKELALIIPNDVQFDVDITGLSDKELIRWHDLMHVFFEKLLEGIGQHTMDFRWDFNKVIIKHSQIVNEMFIRQIKHYSPINNLDKIVVGGEQKKSVLELSSKEEDEPNIFFEAPKHEKIEQTEEV